MNKIPSRYWLPLGFLATITLAFLFLLTLTPQQVADKETAPAADKETTQDVPIGGPFTLTDTQGVSRKAADFRGQYLLLFFGYTFCPDICPVTLQTLSNAVEKMDKKGLKVTPVFITLDPERDNVDAMGHYLANFHPRFVGLTGTVEQIAVAAKAYHVYYAKAGEDADYLVDHSAIVFFMGPDGKYLAHFRHSDSAETMAKGMSNRID
ncbi:MAG: SCO family protein [Rhodospirillaceae bacterium]|nr:MAG: SCO family protein [Rhodospirillaceae bacterium]